MVTFLLPGKLTSKENLSSRTKTPNPEQCPNGGVIGKDYFITWNVHPYIKVILGNRSSRPKKDEDGNDEDKGYKKDCSTVVGKSIYNFNYCFLDKDKNLDGDIGSVDYEELGNVRRRFR